MDMEKSRRARLRHLLRQAPEERFAALASLSEAERDELRRHWRLWARPGQTAPEGDWRTWLICAGRGFGKTRCGAEWVRLVAKRDPDARIALVGSSIAEVRAVMVEGESGLLNISPPGRMPHFEPSLRRLTWGNGAQATLYSVAEPDALRGPQHGYAWCDEVGKWDSSSDRAMRTWDNLVMGLRLGERPRIVATTTPRVSPLMKRLLETDEAVAVTRGSTWDNAANLPGAFVQAMADQFGGTSLGRQELLGEMLGDVEGALWTRSLLEQCRSDEAPLLARVVVGVDPPASATGDACGIVVAGTDRCGNAAVLADATIRKASPERWARAVADTAALWGADRVVAEANQGGAMVGSVLRAADISLPVRLVHARRGKAARAEPVAALYEAGRVRHHGLFAALEDEMCGLMAGGSYEGPGRSPDRADALVWALTELMLGRQSPPSIRAL